MKKLSICITVFNQGELLKSNLANILKYSKDDIEIIVSDNCSTEDIYAIVKSFKDNRIVYTKTNSNNGQDGNIFHALKNCSSNYAFLLRTKDSIIPERISEIIAAIESNPRAAFWRFSAVDSKNRLTCNCINKVYKLGDEACEANSNIMIHPSGEMINLKYISHEDLIDMESFIVKYFPDNMGFVAEELIRLTLLDKGDFITSSAVVWYYPYVEDPTKGTVNLTSDRLSTFHPQYLYRRLDCEYDFIYNRVDTKYKRELLKALVKRYCQACTVAFKYINKSKRLQQYYNCAKVKFSRFNECLIYRAHIKDLTTKYIEYGNDITSYALFCVTIMQVRWTISHYVGPFLRLKLPSIMRSK